MKLALAHYQDKCKWTEVDWCKCRHHDAQEIADHFADIVGEYPDSIVIVAEGPRYYAQYVLGKDYGVSKKRERARVFHQRFRTFMNRCRREEYTDLDFANQFTRFVDREIPKLKGELR